MTTRFFLFLLFLLLILVAGFCENGIPGLGNSAIIDSIVLFIAYLLRLL